MPGFELITSYAFPFMQWLLITSASATLIAGAVLIVQTLFSRWLTPAGRQRLWLLMIVRLLLPVLPASAMSFANIHVEKLWVRATPDAHFTPSPDVSLDSHVDATLPRSQTEVAMQPGAPRTDVMPIGICIGWAVITFAMLGRLLWVNRAMSLRLRRATEINDQSTLQLLRECADIAGLRTTPSIIETDAITTPAVYGIRRPRILMPAGLLESLTLTQQRHVVLHEMSHIRHWDVLANWLLAVMSIIHWFNPLLWLAISRMKTDRELARDAWVLQRTKQDDTESYAGTLIDLAQRLSRGRVSWPSITGGPLAAPLPQLFGRATSLKRRLHMIARLSDSRRGSKLLSLGLLVLIGGGVLTRARAQTMTTAAPANGEVEKPRDAVEQSATKTADADAHDGPMLDRIFPTVQFNAVGFSSAIDYIRHVSGARFFVNWKEIEAAGIDRNAPVTANVHNFKLSRALDLILDSVSTKRATLAYRTVDDVIAISTKRDLDDNKNVVIRAYDIRDLLDLKRPYGSTDLLLKMVKDQVDPKSWKDRGGEVGLMWSLDIGQLVVKQTPENHRRIAAFLQTLRDDHTKKD